MAKTAKKRNPAPVGETKAQKFVRIGQPRVGKAIKAITAIGNLAGRGYVRTDTQVAKIKSLLQATLDETMAKFRADNSKAEGPKIDLS